jgi:hypothetical protein
MWYGDTLWPTLIALASVAAVTGMMWWERRQLPLLIVAMLCIPAAITAIAVERQIVTPREQVIQSLEQLIVHFERQEMNAVVDFVSARTPQLRQFAATAVEKVAISNVRLTDINVELSGEDVPRARTHFRVNADVVYNKIYPLSRQPTRWTATWELEADGRWRILDIEQLDPLTGETTQEARQYVN